MIRYLIIFALMLITSTPLVSKAETEKALSTFATIPILNEGRIKPLDSFARAKLKTFSGRESLPDISPIEWLIEGLFDPAAASQRPLIKIRNPELISALTLEDKYLHSFEELLPKLNAKKEIILELLRKPETEWTQSQSDLVLLQQKMAMFEQLFGSLSPLLPLRIDVPPDAPDYLKPFTGTNITYRDILKFREQLDADLKKIISKKGDDITKYSSLEQTLTFISFAANQLKGKGEHNKIFKVLPTGDNQAFLSPWEVLTQGGTPNTARLTILWAQLAQTENIPDWNKLVANINAQTVSLSGIPQTRINVEYAYNLLHPHDASLGLYIFCLILATTSILLNKQWIMRISGFFLFSGVLVHITGITARIYILSRPPVSTLYETILFVGAVVVAYGLYLWFKRRDTISLIGAAVLGSLLHIISLSKAGEGDDLVMLDAVLNTKFWLTTHVLCITTGYAFCLLASAFAHYMLACRAFMKSFPAHIPTSLQTTTLLSLFFATVGTILGGIWADQSWGRFWGWDPKENGAMLITLWLIWVIHGRISGQTGTLSHQAGLAYLSVIVALSWFGVNLLGVGLHSYGFTDSLALSLGIFVTLETTLIGFLWWRAAHAS